MAANERNLGSGRGRGETVRGDIAVRDGRPLEASEEKLEPMLAGLIAAHERLLEAIEAHRLAVSRADAEAIGRAVGMQAGVLAEIAEFEQSRAALLGERGAKVKTIRAAAATLAEPARTRLMEMADRLRELIGTVRERQDVVRLATRTLLEHTRGLMGQVGAALSHAGTYGRAGKVQSTTPACAVLDMST